MSRIMTAFAQLQVAPWRVGPSQWFGRRNGLSSAGPFRAALGRRTGPCPSSGADAGCRARRAMSMQAAGAMAPWTPAQSLNAQSIDYAKLAEFSGDTLVLGLAEAASEDDAKEEVYKLPQAVEALNSEVGGAIADLVSDAEFKGKMGSSDVVRLPSNGKGLRRIAIFGLGKPDESTGAPTSDAIGQLVSFAVKTGQSSKKGGTVGILMASATGSLVQTAAESAVLASFEDDRFKSNGVDEEPDKKTKEPQAIVLLDAAPDAETQSIRRGMAMASGIILTKELVMSPPNVLNPVSLAECAEQLARDYGFKSKILERQECEERGMGAYLGVSQGSVYPPKFIHLTYTPQGEVKNKIVLVGKGLTFDSGGYNLKAGFGSMIEMMKFDMGGAGSVLGAARVIGELKPPGTEVHFVVAACENMISDNAYRPGDILRASNGKTVEIANTDAEGRLTLADALVYAEGLGDVDCIVDLATLTGAIVVSLGNDYAGLFTPHSGLAGKIEDSAKAAGEKIWRMPMPAEYLELTKSKVADLKNTGGRGGGSITAALFLKEFVDKVPWAHIDIAGTVWAEKAGGPTGYGVRTLVEFVEKFENLDE